MHLYVPSGKHAFCDVNGKSLKLSDITNGMSVKIRAKNVRYHGYEYLFTSAEGSYGMYFALYKLYMSLVKFWETVLGHCGV